MTCKCVETVNEKLKEKHLALKLHTTINTKTCETGERLAIETVSLKRGVKPTKIFLSFCPFCGDRA